jgi:hypothetical protein
VWRLKTSLDCGQEKNQATRVSHDLSSQGEVRSSRFKQGVLLHISLNYNCHHSIESTIIPICDPPIKVQNKYAGASVPNPPIVTITPQLNPFIQRHKRNPHPG